MFRLVATVNPDVNPPIWYAVGVADAIHRIMFGSDLIVTSMRDLKHKTPIHSTGNAFDLRTRDQAQDQRVRFYLQLKKTLPAAFDVVLEPDPQPHIHVEYQPKPGEAEFPKYPEQVQDERNKSLLAAAAPKAAQS